MRVPRDDDRDDEGERLIRLGALLVAATCAGCAGLSARAAAPDERNERVASPPDRIAPIRGPSAYVHVVSPYDATLVRLDEHDAVVDACPAPCDRDLPLDGVYRIDGPRIRSSWPFRLQDNASHRIVLTVSPSLRSTYGTAKALGAVGGAAMVVGIASMLVAIMVATTNHDANNGSPVPCPACDAAFVGGAIVGVAGVGLSITSVVIGIANMSSGVAPVAAW